MGESQVYRLHDEPESDLEYLTDDDLKELPAVRRRLRRRSADPSCRERILRMLDESDGPELANYDAHREHLRTVIDPD